eukprot:361988-Chlamydomonas_euryale.AAC.7
MGNGSFQRARKRKGRRRLGNKEPEGEGKSKMTRESLKGQKLESRKIRHGRQNEQKRLGQLAQTPLPLQDGQQLLPHPEQAPPHG